MKNRLKCFSLILLLTCITHNACTIRPPLQENKKIGVNMKKYVESVGILMTFGRGIISEKIRVPEHIVAIVGTGYLVKHDDNYYVVTCKHILEDRFNKNWEFLLSLNHISDKYDESKSNLYLNKDYISNPNDNDMKTFDIALLEVENKISKPNFRALCLSLYNAPKLDFGDIIYVIGFPMETGM